MLHEAGVGDEVYRQEACPEGCCQEELGTACNLGEDEKGTDRKEEW